MEPEAASVAATAAKTPRPVAGLPAAVVVHDVEEATAPEACTPPRVTMPDGTDAMLLAEALREAGRWQEAAAAYTAAIEARRSPRAQSGQARLELWRCLLQRGACLDKLGALQRA